MSRRIRIIGRFEFYGGTNEMICFCKIINMWSKHTGTILQITFKAIPLVNKLWMHILKLCILPRQRHRQIADAIMFAVTSYLTFYLWLANTRNSMAYVPFFRGIAFVFVYCQTLRERKKEVLLYDQKFRSQHSKFCKTYFVCKTRLSLAFSLFLKRDFYWTLVRVILRIIFYVNLL